MAQITLLGQAEARHSSCLNTGIGPRDPRLSMLGRRKHLRFLLSQPVEGQLRVREEVTIEEWADGEVVVLAPEPCRCDDRFTLEIPEPVHRRVNVKVTDCRPAIAHDGGIRHRCRLSIDAAGSEGSAT